MLLSLVLSVSTHFCLAAARQSMRCCLRLLTAAVLANLCAPDGLEVCLCCGESAGRRAATRPPHVQI